MSGKLDGKVSIVTGGSSGIGLGAAQAFAAEGARVFITGRNQKSLDAATRTIGHDAEGLQGDTSVLHDIDRIYQTVKNKAGRIDVLFVNAGIFAPSPLGEISEEHFDSMFNTNVRGLLFTVQKALPLLSKGSSVILNASIATTIGAPALSVYAATKAAVRALARTWILDLKGKGIRLNVLSPGHIDTPGLNALLNAQMKAGLIETIPSGRLGTAEDIGKAAVFLASDDSSYMNGDELTVDGGVAQY